MSDVEALLMQADKAERLAQNVGNPADCKTLLDFAAELRSRAAKISNDPAAID